MNLQSNIPSALHASLHASMVAATAISVVFSSAAVRLAGAQSRGLSRELTARVSQYRVSWNTKDATALADYFTADADMIMGNGPMLDGRKAIQGWWRDYFAVQEPERRLTIEIMSARAITADLALVNVRTTTGGRTAGGLELPARKARGTWVLVRQNGDWYISVMRGMPTQQDRIIRDVQPKETGAEAVSHELLETDRARAAAAEAGDDEGSKRGVTAERFFRGVYGGDPSVVDAFAADEITVTYPVFRSIFGKPTLQGIQEVRNFARGFGQRWADPQISIEETVEAAGRVVLRWIFQARDVRSRPGGSPPANRVHRWTGITVYRFDGRGKIVAEVGEESEPVLVAPVTGR